MKHFLAPSFFPTALLLASVALVGCSSSDSSDRSALNAGEPAQGAAQGPTQGFADGDGAAGAAQIDAACTRYFDALIARRKRCGLVRTILFLEASEGVRDSFMAVCRQRSTRTGTGYTPEFHESCASTFDDAGCDDYGAIVESCWEPRGELVAGSGCSTDDQCADGYCRLPSDAKPGSTCGTCAVPTWAREGDACYGKRDVKCVAGLACEDDAYPSYHGHSGDCALPGRAYAKEGEACRSPDGTGSAFEKFCGTGLYCKSGTCAPQTVLSIGESCGLDEIRCEDGSDCVLVGTLADRDYRCARSVGIGEACGVDAGGYCNGWVACGATGKCELTQPDLQCSTAPAAAAPAEPMKCVGVAASCSGRAAGTCGAQEGCSFVQHYRYSASGGYFESVCEGTPVACSSIQTEARCADQSGCRWE